MIWPTRVQAIVNALAELLPELVFQMVDGERVSAPDESRRQLTGMVAAQCAFEQVGGFRWGTKRADPGRPLSADTIAIDTPFVGWDFQLPAGQIAQWPESIDLTGQVFVPVEPVNHLSVPPFLPVPEPTPPPTDALEAILQALAELDTRMREQALALLAGQQALIEALRRLEVEATLVRVSLADLHDHPPTYTGKVWAWPLTLRPRRDS